MMRTIDIRNERTPSRTGHRGGRSPVFFRGVLAALMTITTCFAAVAQLHIPASVVACGGTSTAGQAFSVQGTIGQGTIGVNEASGFADSAGFWYIVRNHGGTVGVESNSPGTATFALTACTPNPFADVITVHWVQASAQSVRIRLLDVLGRTTAVYECGRREAGAHTFVVRRAMLPPGVYVVVIENGKAGRDTRLVIAR